MHLTGAAMMGASAKVRPTLQVTVTGNQFATGTQHVHQFGAITATVTGGSGSYAYSWNQTVFSATSETWDFVGQGSSQIVPTVRASFSGGNSRCDYFVGVTDNVTGAETGSATSSCTYVNIG